MSTCMTICIALACLIPLSVAGPLRAAEPEAAALASTGPWSGAASEQTGVAAALAAMPMAFEQNVGKSDERVAFLTRGTGYALFLAQLERAERAEVATSVLRMRLAVARRSPKRLRPSNSLSGMVLAVRR